MNRTDSLSGIKYLKIKYTKVIAVYTKIEVAGSITCVDVAFAAAVAAAVAGAVAAAVAGAGAGAAVAVAAVAVAGAVAVDVVVLVEDIFTNKILYSIYN